MKKGADTSPGKSKPETYRLEEEIQATVGALERLHYDGDLTKVKHSIEHCGLMSKLWGLQALVAGKRGDMGLALQASKEAGEWERRKNAALEKKRVDLLEEIRDTLARQNAEAAELAQLDEIDE